MAWRILVDEDTTDEYDVQLLRHIPGIEVRHVGKPNAPPLGLQDPEILVWCEANDFILLTGNRRTMPSHLTAHLESGRHVPGIFEVRRMRKIGEIVNAIIRLVDETEFQQHRDLIRYLPDA